MGDEAAEEYRRLFIEEQARSEADRRALVEEFEKAIPVDYSPEDVKEKIRDLMKDAYATLGHLIKSADKESVRFAAAKYVFDIGIGQIAINDDNDPNKVLVDLLKELTDPQGKKSETTATDNK
jgi:hypothetical protein